MASNSIAESHRKDVMVRPPFRQDWLNFVLFRQLFQKFHRHASASRPQSRHLQDFEALKGRVSHNQ